MEINPCVIIDETEHLVDDTIDPIVIGGFVNQETMMKFTINRMQDRDWYWLPMVSPSKY